MTCLAKRIAFWTVFLAFVSVVGGVLWVKLDPPRNHPALVDWSVRRHLARMGSADPMTGVRAWNELERLFLVSWTAYDRIVWQVKQDAWTPDDRPISFALIQHGGRYVASAGYARGDCRTVTEALMAMLYQERGRITSFEGDWRQWWEANWPAYSVRDRGGPSPGLESTRGKR